jgi:hypothetical protein
VTDDAITFMIGERAVTLPKTHEKAAEILAMFQGNTSEAKILAALESAVRRAVRFLGGKLELREENGQEVAYYKGLNVGPAVVRRIVEFQRAKLPTAPLVRFLDRLVLNPSWRAVQQLYDFLVHEGLPLTANGTFLACKGIQDNGFSVLAGDKTQITQGVTDDAGHVRNWLGDEPRMNRAAVQDDPAVGCGPGLHAGAPAYAEGWGTQRVTVEIDPADVVSIPSDCGYQKLRCCGYKVVAGYDGRVTAPLASVKDQKIVQRSGKPPIFKAKAAPAEAGKPRTFRYKGKDYRLLAEDRRQRVLQTIATGKILIQSK